LVIKTGTAKQRAEAKNVTINKQVKCLTSQTLYCLTNAQKYKILSEFYIHCSVHRLCILIRSNKMQQMQAFITVNLL